MRSLSSTLLAAQKKHVKKELIKLVLTDNGNTYTYYSVSGNNRILERELIEEDDSQRAYVVLGDFDKTISSLDLEGFKGVLSDGMATTSDEYSAHAPMYVIGQHEQSSQTGLTVILTLAGIPNLLNEDEASEAYTLESDDTQTVKTLFRLIAGDSGVSILTCYDHCQSYDVTFDSEDDLIDTFIPADTFSIPFKSNRLTKLKELLNYTDCVMRVEADGKIHVRVPTVTTSTTWAANTAYAVGATVVPTTANEVEYRCTSAGTSHASTEPTWANATEVADTITDGTVTWTVGYDYDYRAPSPNYPTYHTFFSETYRRRVVIPGYIEVESSPSHDTIYTGNASDSGYSSYPAHLKKRDHYRIRATSNAQCTNIATAILSHAQAAAERGWGIVPMNVGAEVHDFVKVKDARLGDYRVGNQSYIRWYYKAGKQPTMEFRFGKIGAGVAGTAVTSGEGGTHTHPEFVTINNYLQQIFDWIQAHGDVHSFDIYDQNNNYVGTLGGLTNTVFLAALATAANLKLYNSSPTGGVVIAAGELPGTPDDGTLLLKALVAVKVDSGDSFIIPVL